MVIIYLNCARLPYLAESTFNNTEKIIFWWTSVERFTLKFNSFPVKFNIKIIKSELNI